MLCKERALLDPLDIPPFFAPRQACLRGITHHNGATSDAPGACSAPRACTIDAAPRPTNIVLRRVTDVQSALHQKRRADAPETTMNGWAGTHTAQPARGKCRPGGPGQSDAMNCPVNRSGPSTLCSRNPADNAHAYFD